MRLAGWPLSPPNLAHVRWLTGVGAWAVADQALVSVANFMFSILLARWLDPGEYGAFAAGYALLWFAWAFYKGLLLDPAMVFSTTRFGDDVGRYHSLLLLLHALLSLPLALALLATGAAAQLLLGSAAEFPWLSLAAAAPIIFLPALLRGLCRARLRTGVGAIGAILYAVAMAVGALLLYRLQRLSAASGFALLAAASAVSAAGVIWQLGLGADGLGFGRDGMLARVVAEHWRYGRWLLGANLLSWMPANIWYAALPVLTGAEEAGILRALANLAQPAAQGYGVAHSLLIPLFVRADASGRFATTVTLATAAVAALSVGFSVVVGIFSAPLVHWLYDGRYAPQVLLVWLILARTVLMGISVVQSAAMQAIERADWLLAGFAAAAGVIVLVGLPATWIWGVRGAVIGQLVAELTVVLCLWWRLRRRAAARAGAGSMGRAAAAAPLPVHDVD